MDWEVCLSTVVTGLVVVFAALILLIIIVWAFGKLFQAMDVSKKNKSSKPAEPQVKAAAPAPKPAAVAEDGLTDEVVAAITAAIGCMLASEGNTKPFTIKSIRRTRSGRNAWNMAGIAENTAAF